MPEFPDLELYLHALRPRLLGQELREVVQKDPFIVRSVEPPIQHLQGKRVVGLSRLGKRLVIHWQDDYFLIIHLMIAGRFRWLNAPKGCLIAWCFENGWLGLSEAGTKRRARVHLVQGESALQLHDPGGLEIFSLDSQQFAQQLRQRRHTLKRSLSDPTIFAGIGNAYSDEILHHARLSPVRLSTQLQDEEVERLFHSCRHVLSHWKDKHIAHWGDAFPTTVTAFHPDMAAHGKYLQPCPQCNQPIQRIRYAGNETNYCVSCQTQGRLLADRALSRLLKRDWPDSLPDAGPGQPP